MSTTFFLTLVFFFFFFYGPHPDLHSFPTRRSSDIITSESTTSKSVSCSNIPSASTPLAAVMRSEEHTSELQSRFDLVCRLLLEKKKPICLPAISHSPFTRL